MSCAKRLNRSICLLGCGLDRVGRRKHQFNRIGQVAPMCPHMMAHWWGHIGATWPIRLNPPSAAAMRPYVKLLWPLVSIYLAPPSCFISNYFFLFSRELHVPWPSSGAHPTFGGRISVNRTHKQPSPAIPGFDTGLDPRLMKQVTLTQLSPSETPGSFCEHETIN